MRDDSGLRFLHSGEACGLFAMPLATVEHGLWRVDRINPETEQSDKPRPTAQNFRTYGKLNQSKSKVPTANGLETECEGLKQQLVDTHRFIADSLEKIESLRTVQG